MFTNIVLKVLLIEVVSLINKLVKDVMLDLLVSEEIKHRPQLITQN
jgi:hypothetical protein